MADTYLNITGKPVKLIELADNTYAFAFAQMGGEIYCDTKIAGVTAEAIGGDIPCNELLVQADPNNTVDVYVGTKTKQTIKLTKGESETLPIHNANQVYVKTVSDTATVNWMAK